jgi:hypothetical protein
MDSDQQDPLALRAESYATARTASQDWYEVEKVNLNNILNGKAANEDPGIRPGDMQLC